MEDQHFCQSCSMPLDDASVKGTEKDGNLSETYCKYCYANGDFLQPDLTVGEMQEIVRSQMEKMNPPARLVDLSVKMLPHLKRWR